MKKKRNPRVIALSLLGIVFMVLTFAIHWSFIIGAVISSWLGWKILINEK